MVVHWEDRNVADQERAEREWLIFVPSVPFYFYQLGVEEILGWRCGILGCLNSVDKWDRISRFHEAPDRDL